MSQPALNLAIGGDGLRPLIETIVGEVLARLKHTEGDNDKRLAYTEAEAAALLGLNQWQLRDERLKGRIASTRGPGRRIRYTKADLENYLLRNREAVTA